MASAVTVDNKQAGQPITTNSCGVLALVSVAFAAGVAVGAVAGPRDFAVRRLVTGAHVGPPAAQTKLDTLAAAAKANAALVKVFESPPRAYCVTDAPGCEYRRVRCNVSTVRATSAVVVQGPLRHNGVFPQLQLMLERNPGVHFVLVVTNRAAHIANQLIKPKTNEIKQ